MFGTKKPPATKPAEGSMEDLMAALKEADSNHQKRVKQDKKKKGGPGWFSGVPGMIKAGVIAALAVVTILVVDGLRREAGELNASLAQVSGQVTILKGGTSSTRASIPARTVAKKSAEKSGAE